MQDGLDGRRRRIRIKHRCTLGIDHVGITQLLEFRQALQNIQFDRSKTRGLDRGQVPPASLNIKNVHPLAENIFNLLLS